MSHASGMVLPKMSKGLRWLKIVLRWLIWAGLLLVFARGVFSIILPPADSTKQAAAAPALIEPDGLRAFPLLFANEYLTWVAPNPSDGEPRFKPLWATSWDEQGAGGIERGGRGQSEDGAWIYGVEALEKEHWLVTVFAKVRCMPKAQAIESQKNNPAEKTILVDEEVRTLFLTVPVAKSGQGWVVYDYPSFQPLPSREGSPEPLYTGQNITDKDEQVQKLLTGFFKSFTGQGEIAYFLLPGSPVFEGLNDLNFESVEEITLLKKDSDLLALASVLLQDSLTGAHFVTRFTFRLVEKDGRWYIKEMIERGV